MARRFSLLAMDDAEMAAARRILGATSVEQNGSYLYGLADDEAVKRLVDNGLLLNVEPEEPLVERASEPLMTLEALSDDAGGIATAVRPIAYATARLSAPLTAERQNTLGDMGIRLTRRLGRNVYVAQVDSVRIPEALPTWLEFGGYGAEGTLGPELSSRLKEMRAKDLYSDSLTFDNPLASEPQLAGSVPTAPSSPLVDYDVSCHDVASLNQLEDLLKRSPQVEKVQRGEERLRISVRKGVNERALLEMLGGIEEVGTVESYIPPEIQLSFATEAALGPSCKIADLPWRGNGQVIGIADTGIDAEHPDFVGRVTVRLVAQPLSPRDPRGHGTHVASIAAGTGAASGGQLAGLASHARIFMQSLDNQDLRLDVGVGLKPLLREAYNNDVRVQNLSWGAAVEGRYNLDARDIDSFVYENPDLLVVVACGNDGEQEVGTATGGRIRLKSLASLAAAKNGLAVGATCSPRTDGPYAGLTWKSYDGKRPPTLPPMSELPLTGNVDVVAALSSRGPSDDGRIKPDLLAPGVGIAAARSADCTARHPYPGHSDHYHYSTGTSMAAPLIAGAAVVVRQYFTEERTHTPSAALLKATLINGASWLRGEVWEDPQIGRPNFHQGFGRFVLGHAIPLPGAAFQLEFEDVANNSAEALRQGNAENSRWRRRLTVKARHPLSVTLVWLDPPDRGLQHELDLVVVSPSSKKHVGNSGLQRLAYEAFDPRNNIEQVFVPEPEPGEWVVYVFARNTFQGSQGFAIAMTGAFQS
jgi:subtilisin family serine protease